MLLVGEPTSTFLTSGLSTSGDANMKTPEELYKQRKEAFVSNLTGGSIIEINLVTAIAPVSTSYPPYSQQYLNPNTFR